MNCFNHSEIPAVAICKSCSRALCNQCATEVEKAMACRERCESDVRALQQLIASNLATRAIGSQVLRGYPTTLFVSAFFLATSGVVFIAFDLSTGLKMGFMLPLGALFLAMGGYQLLRALRMRAQKNKLSP